MKVSRYIPKLAFHNIRKKKNRTWLSFVSVMLSACIIYVALTLFFTVFSLSKSLVNETTGMWHYQFETSSFEVDDPFRYQISYYSDPNEDHIAYYYVDDTNDFFSLEAGRLPENKYELLSSSNSSFDLGQEIKGYTIVGLYQPSFAGEGPLLSIDESLKTPSCHYFVKDARIQDANSLDNLAKLAHVSTSHVIENTQRITNDVISNYLQDTTMLLGMFILIIVLAVLICLVSVYNVLIVNDHERRKEIGLLKSIGITVKELKVMIFLEMSMIGIVAGIVGVGIGTIICTGVLYPILDNFKVAFAWSYVLRPLLMLIAIFGSSAMMIGCGFMLYRHYFTSSPIVDLKGEPVQYDIPYDVNRFNLDSATWRLFVIYNERIKKQTRNLRRSFLFIMVAITLFCGIWISNFLYQKNYLGVPMDVGIRPAQLLMGQTAIYPEFDDKLYALSIEEDTKMDFMRIERSIMGLKYYMPYDSFSELYHHTNFDSEGIKEYQNQKWSTQAHFGVVLDDVQLKELEPYIVYGKLEDLNRNSTVLICNQYNHFETSKPLREFDQSSQVMCEAIDAKMNLAPQLYNVDVMINLPFEELNLKYSTVDQYPFTIAFTYESFQTLFGTTSNYEASLKLEQNNNHLLLQQSILAALNDLGLSSELQATDYIQVKEDGSFAVFIIEVLLYPLFLMLVVVGIININNVLKGNIHLKKTDFSTLKSVGMTDSQLKMVMVYEYAENYINAGVITFLISIAVYLLEKFVPIASTFRIGDNFAGMFIISFAILSPLVIVILAVLSFKHLVGITALDGMKNIE